MKVSRKVRFTVAMTVWLAVAGMLIYRGFLFWPNVESDTLRIGALVLAAVVGLGKGFFVIAKSTRRTAGYINRRPQKDWVFLSFHPVLYLLIPVMIGFGVLLRTQVGESHPEVVLGVYVAIGLALLIGVRGFRQVAIEE